MNPFSRKPFFLKEKADNTKSGTPEKKESPPSPPAERVSRNEKAEKKLKSAVEPPTTPQTPPTRTADTPEVKIPESATYETRGGERIARWTSQFDGGPIEYKFPPSPPSTSTEAKPPTSPASTEPKPLYSVHAPEKEIKLGDHPLSPGLREHMQGGGASSTPTEAKSPASTEPKPTTPAQPSSLNRDIPRINTPSIHDGRPISPGTLEKIQDFNRESRYRIANSPDIPAPTENESGPVRNMREYARKQQQKYRKEQNQDQKPSSSAETQKSLKAKDSTPTSPSSVAQAETVPPKKQTPPRNHQTTEHDVPEARTERTNSGAPRVRQNIDTGSTVVVDSEGRKISGTRQSDISPERTTVPVTQSSNTSSGETQIETSTITTKPEKNRVTQEMEFATRVNTQTGQKTLHWKKSNETTWQGSDGFTSSDNFPQHSITRGTRPPTGFENLYTPNKDEESGNNGTPEQSPTPEPQTDPLKVAREFDATGDIDAETARRDQEEIAKYKAEQAKKTTEQKEQERREAKDMFDLGRGDTSGVTEITGEKAKKYKVLPDKTSTVTNTTSTQPENTKNPSLAQGPEPVIDTRKNLPPMYGDRSTGVSVAARDDGHSETPVQGRGTTIYQPVNLPPTEKHPQGERAQISYTPPPQTMNGAYNPYAGIDRLRQEEQQEGWTPFQGPREWREGSDREQQLQQSFGGRGKELLNPTLALQQTAAQSKGDGMIINGSPHPDLARRRAERLAKRDAENRPGGNNNPIFTEDGTSRAGDVISTFDFGATIGSRHAIVDNNTGRVWRTRQDYREGKPPVAVQVNRGYVNYVDSGGSQSAPNSDQLMELIAPNPYNLPFSTEQHRVFVANGTIYAGGRDADKNGQISTRRIGRYNADSGEVIIDQKDPAFIEWRRKMEKDKPIPPGQDQFL